MMRPNQLTTKIIYEDLKFNLNVVPRVETTYLAVDWKVWQNLSSNFILTRSTGSITEMTDGYRKIRWQRKKEVEKIFGNALYCF
jgi:hypothetical protein